MVQHHAGSPESPDGIGNPLSRDIERRAVDGFEHRRKLTFRIQVRGWRNTNGPSQGRSKIGNNIGMKVGCNNRV